MFGSRTDLEAAEVHLDLGRPQGRSIGRSQLGRLQVEPRKLPRHVLLHGWLARYHLCVGRQVIRFRIPPEHGCLCRRSRARKG